MDREGQGRKSMSMDVDVKREPWEGLAAPSKGEEEGRNAQGVTRSCVQR